MTPSEHLNDLLKAGMDTAQAEAVAMAIKASQGDLATQADIDHLRAEWKTKISLLKWGIGITVALVMIPLIYEILVIILLWNFDI